MLGSGVSSTGLRNLGFRNLGITEGNHSNRFDIDENALLTGTEILVAIALDFLKNSGEYMRKTQDL